MQWQTCMATWAKPWQPCGWWDWQMLLDHGQEARQHLCRQATSSIEAQTAWRLFPSLSVSRWLPCSLPTLIPLQLPRLLCKIIRSYQIVHVGLEYINSDITPLEQKRVGLQLQQEAKDAGGAVHTLLGNLELMNLNSQFAYVSPGGARCSGSRCCSCDCRQEHRTAAHRWRALVAPPNGIGQHS